VRFGLFYLRATKLGSRNGLPSLHRKMQRDFKTRIAIGDKMGPRSAVWIIATAKNDVYAAHRISKGAEKLSFHQSRICRRAFTKEYGAPKTMTDRVLDRWTRAETPPAGTNRMVRLLSICFPGGHITPSTVSTKKPTILLEPAVPGRSKNLEVALTNDPPAIVAALIEQRLAKVSAVVLATHKMPNGETLVLFSCDTEHHLGDLIMPAGMHEPDDLVFPLTGSTGQPIPIFLTTYIRPQGDDDCFTCFELMGFRVPGG
jgi:hypothetical protein